MFHQHLSLIKPLLIPCLGLGEDIFQDEAEMYLESIYPLAAYMSNLPDGTNICTAQELQGGEMLPSRRTHV